MKAARLAGFSGIVAIALTSLVVPDGVMAKIRQVKPSLEEPADAIAFHVSSRFQNRKGQHDELLVLPSGEVRLRTASPGPNQWGAENRVGEFSFKGDPGLFSKLRKQLEGKLVPQSQLKVKLKPGATIETLSLRAKGADLRMAIRDAHQADPTFEALSSELGKLKAKALLHPTRAIELKCSRKKKLECSLAAIGKSASSVPLPGTITYTFYCVKDDNRLLELMKVEKRPVKTFKTRSLSLELEPGKRYPLPLKKNCSGRVALAIGGQGAPQSGLLDEALLVSNSVK